MKKLLILSSIIIALPLSIMAQDDDLYFVPKKKSEVKAAKQTYYIGSNRDVDEYNRRGKYVSSTEPVKAFDGKGDDIIFFDEVEGVYPDSVVVDSLANWAGGASPVMRESERSGKKSSNYSAYDYDDDDYIYSRQLDRWYGIYDPWFYGPSYYGFHRYYWHSPYYYSGWYGWYDPWFYGSWYGWYDPWFYSCYWGHWGWYDPWYYPINPGGGHFHPGVGIASAKPSRGGAIQKSSFASGRSGSGRRSGFYDIAKQSAAKESYSSQSQRGQRVSSTRGTGRRESTSATTDRFGSPTRSTFGSSMGSYGSGGSFSGGGSRSSVGGGSVGSGGGSSSGGGSHGGRR